MANRLRVVNKPLPLPADSPLAEPLARTRRKAHHDLLIRLGERHEQQGRPDRAQISYQRAARAHPEENFAHRLLGLLALRSGRFEEAADSFKTCLAINTPYTADFLYAALACIKAGRGAEALSLLAAR
jgi:tetratricopeptide (TPR) repeat protein